MKPLHEDRRLMIRNHFFCAEWGQVFDRNPTPNPELESNGLRATVLQVVSLLTNRKVSFSAPVASVAPRGDKARWGEGCGIISYHYL